jgi:hypothetical protein
MAGYGVAVSLRGKVLLAWVLMCSGGCSILLHVDADQCSTNVDCTSRGTSFANHVCVAGTCVPSEAGVGPEASTSSDGSVEGSVATCNSVLDCPVPAGATHPEVACDVDAHLCRQLTTDECAFVLGDYTGVSGPNGSPDPIFIGAFATIPPAAPESTPSYLNYKLAQSDFAGGIPAGGGSALRTPVIVVCDDTADPLVVMNHLVNDVNVSAVIAALPSATLRTTFSAVNLSGGSGPPVFFMNPFGADSSLTSLPTNGLLWHMLGQPSDLASAYAAFFPRVEAYVRTLQGIPAGTPMKVATISATSPTVTLDLAKAVEGVLTWNGGPAVASNTANYVDIPIPQSSLTGTDPSQIDVSSQAAQLQAFHPNVIVSFASEELSYLLQLYEINNTGVAPFYLLSPYNNDSVTIPQWIGSIDNRRKRFAGINFAADVDNPVLLAYNSHFTSAGNPAGALGGENYYDAAYFTIDSLIAAGRTTMLTGTRVGEGMPRLIDPSGTTLDVGPTDIGDVTSALVTLGGPNVDLVGTLGPPDFSLTTGARISEGSVYCISRDTTTPDGGGIPSLALSYTEDVLTLSADDAGAPGDGGAAPALQGTFSCYSGM